MLCCSVFFFQAEDGIRDLVRSRGLGDVYKRQNLDTSASDESMTEATAVVEALADTVDALMGDVPRDVDGMFPGNLPRHDRAWRLLYESLGWSVPHAASALGGAAVAHQLITGMFTAFPPFWAAALGAVLGLLGNAFRPSSQVDRDQQSLG